MASGTRGSRATRESDDQSSRVRVMASVAITVAVSAGRSQAANVGSAMPTSTPIGKAHFA